MKLPAKQEKVVILVEPGAGVSYGHFQSNLTLWHEVLLSKEFMPITVSWDLAADEQFDHRHFLTAGKILRWLEALVSKKWKSRWREFCLYTRAFRLSRRTGWPVIGLTATTPFAVALASRFYRPLAPWGQIVMYSGLMWKNGKAAVQPRSLWAFTRLVGSGCKLICNTKQGRDVLSSVIHSGGSSPAIFFNPGPVVPPSAATGVSRARCPRSLFVEGQDNPIRTSVEHVMRASLRTPIRRLTVHHVGRDQVRLVSSEPWETPSFVKELVVRSDFLPSKEFPRLFQEHQYSLVAYASNFVQESGNLLCSVLYGAPVLASRFSHAKETFAECGRLGELFDYADYEDFSRAWERLVSWNDEQWREFEEARIKMSNTVNYQITIPKVLAWLGIGGGT